MSYEELVREAFIDPLRSVLIVDDEYPTWNSLVDVATSKAKPNKGWLKNTDNVTQTIATFRERSPSLIIDMDDGESLSSDKSEEIASHLHQSDLLVLDYQLNDPKVDGEKCVLLAGSVLRNDHFNLVVVHTSSDKVDDAFEQIVLSLISEKKQSPPKLLEEAQKVIASKALDLIDDKEDKDELSDRIAKVEDELLTHLGAREFIYCYLKCKGSNFQYRAFTETAGPLAGFSNYVVNSLGVDKKNLPAIGAYVLHKQQENFCEKFSSEIHKSLKWSDKRDNTKVSWIRTSKGFIAFANKSDAATLLETLSTALELWKPTPTRLLSAKMRSEIDRQGVIAEDEIFADSLVFRKFYDSLISAERSASDRKVALKNHIDRHIESLGDQSSEALIDFGLKMVNLDLGNQDEDTKFIKHYGDLGEVDLSIPTSRYNSYVCTKAIVGHHINIGHVFSTSEGENEKYWVCLSPACDMVPGQRKVGLHHGNGRTKSFLAVQLYGGYNIAELTDTDINSNEFVFLKIDGRIKAKSIFPKPSGNENPSGREPHWRMFFAQDKGCFIDVENGSKFNLNVQWLKSEENGLEICDSVIVEIKWQLRYEYALNLNQKLGGNLTRVGLEFLT